jgi:hypothetical protein
VTNKTKDLYSICRFTTDMLKQISVKAIKGKNALKQMYNEAQIYLDNIGFSKEQILSLTDSDKAIRTYLFSQGKEKILLEYQQDNVEEVLKLVFHPMEIKFVYDILLMRFNQLAKEKGSVYIFNT